jgi:hypothetical protein
MEDNRTLDVIVGLLGLGILIWLLANALIDMIRGNKHRKVYHNLIIVGICLIYSLKIVLKDLLGVV